MWRTGRVILQAGERGAWTRARAPGALFLLATALNAAPILRFSHLPLTDGPSHVYNASLLVRYAADPAGPVGQLVAWNTSVPPNLLAHGLMASAMAAAVPPLMAERLLLLAYAVLLPLALRYAMRGAAPRSGGLEYLGLVVVFNSHVHWGFYNFLAGLVGYLGALGYWLRIRAMPPGGAATGGMTAAVLVLYFCHPVPLVEFWMTVAVVLAIDAVRDRRSALRSAIHIAGASLPAVLLLVHYVFTRPPALVADPQVGWPTARYAASLLLKLAPLATYTGAERLAALALGVTLAVSLAWSAARGALSRTSRSLLAAAVVTGLAMFVAPTQAAGGTLVTPRLVYFPLFLVLIALAGRWPARARVTFAAIGVTLSVISASARWPVYARYEDRMRDFVELAASWPVSGPVYFATAGDGTAMVLDRSGTPPLPASAWGYVASERGQLLSSDYQGLLGYFPLVYRAAAPAAAWTPPACIAPPGPGRTPPGGGPAAKPGAVVVWIDAEHPATQSCLQRLPGVRWRATSRGAGALFEMPALVVAR